MGRVFATPVLCPTALMLFTWIQNSNIPFACLSRSRWSSPILRCFFALLAESTGKSDRSSGPRSWGKRNGFKIWQVSSLCQCSTCLSRLVYLWTLSSAWDPLLISLWSLSSESDPFSLSNDFWYTRCRFWANFWLNVTHGGFPGNVLIQYNIQNISMCLRRGAISSFSSAMNHLPFNGQSQYLRFLEVEFA